MSDDPEAADRRILGAVAEEFAGDLVMRYGAERAGFIAAVVLANVMKTNPSGDHQKLLTGLNTWILKFLAARRETAH